MKRTILLFLSVMMTVIMTAGEVTPQQALQQAQKFLQQTPSGMKRSQAEVPQLKMAGRVSGLYVFNAEQNQGYVIVSNDDRTAPILGYSETGTLDPDNMPCNMRAWLQGYADEIAWLNEHNIQPTASQNPRRTASAVKAPIAPLVKTHWDQGSPYNDNCPEYESDNKAVTGCVATAMAQVMKYHEYANMTGDIPGYDTDFQGSSCIAVSTLTATSFDWGNMLNDYTNSATDTQKSAVAKLMQYCGASVKMHYGSVSSSNTTEVVTALKTYFGYNSTAQMAVRSLYTYNEWIELIYNELKQNRPVVYGGQSSGGGHEFVCDGYQGEDYFHINWGWGGMSDNYFKLSALDSDHQGIGGSSSTDGYHYGQDAVVGVQKPSDEGTVLNISTHLLDLSVTAISGPTSATAGQEVTYTLTVANNASLDYSGDIYLGIKYGDSEPYSYGLLSGDLFNIPAGGSKDCAIKTTFESAGTYKLVFFWPNDQGSYSTYGDVLTTVTVSSGKPRTSDLDLTTTIKQIETRSDNNFYGTTLKGVLTVSNPSTDYDFEGYYEWMVDGVAMVFDSKHTYIPAGGSIDVPFEASGRTINTNYPLQVCYLRNSDWTDWNVLATLTCKPAIVTIDASGSKTVLQPTNSYTVPDNVVSVEMTGAGVTSVTKNSNPNTLYILGSSDAVPAGLTNVVRFNGTTYSASSITLTDGYNFASPVDFTATNIVFNYTFTKGADGSKGWNTIMLPFDVTSVTADDVAIDWFHDSGETGKQFWLKEFVSDEPGVVNFDFVSGTTMKANTPYIVAFPGDHWGAAYDLSTKAIKFVGETNTTVHKSDAVSSVTGANYRFIGNTLTDATNNIYTINDDGDKFVAGNGSAPFRAYFKPGIFDPTLGSLGIGSGGETTGIETMSDVRGMMSDVWYDLQGRRVENPTKGVYIKNGKLFIKK